MWRQVLLPLLQLQQPAFFTCSAFVPPSSQVLAMSLVFCMYPYGLPRVNAGAHPRALGDWWRGRYCADGQCLFQGRESTGMSDTSQFEAHAPDRSRPLATLRTAAPCTGQAHSLA